MGRAAGTLGTRTLGAGVLAALVMVGGATTAAATAANPAPLLEVSELPAGYAVGVGSPLQRTNVAASAPTLTRCTWGTATRVAGPFPVITSSGFVRGGTPSVPSGNVQETVWQFDAPKTATAYAARLAKTYAAATTCNPLHEPDPAPGSTGRVDAGRFTRLRIGAIGDPSFALTYAPAPGAPRSQIALFRTGATVGTLTVTDPTVTPAAFAALVRKAATRAA